MQKSPDLLESRLGDRFFGWGNFYYKFTGNMSGKIEREVKRIAVAFGVQITHSLPRDKFLEFIASNGTRALLIGFDMATENLAWMIEGVGFVSCVINFNGEIPQVTVCEGCNTDFLARGLYRLGIEEEEVSAQLNHPLSAHEKLELRLSMPREFWPKKWLDEEET